MDASTPDTSAMNTPSTSVAPSVAGDVPKTLKLSLAVRKNLRDEWETKIPNLEAQLTSVLGIPWKISIDPPYIYTFAQDSFAKQSTGQMIAQYVEEALTGLTTFTSTHGPPGTAALNTLCPTHTLTLSPSTNPNINYSGTEIKTHSSGMLHVVFAPAYLGTNIGDATLDLADTINAAGVAAAGPDGATALDSNFNAKAGIRRDYDPSINAVQERMQTLLATPVLTLEPNFSTNFATLAAYATTTTTPPSSATTYPLPHDWQSRLGEHTLAYFAAFADTLDRLGFAGDGLMQEGWREAVERGVVGVRVVGRLGRGGYSECVVEGGVCWVQVTPGAWTVNVGDVGGDVLDVL